MIKNKYVAFVLYVVLLTAFCAALDWLYTVYFTHSAFQFSADRDLWMPMLLGTATGWVYYLRDNGRK